MVAAGWLLAQAALAALSLLGVVLSGLQVWGEHAQKRLRRPRQLLVRSALAGSSLQLVRCVDPWGVLGVWSPQVYISLSYFVTASVYGVLGAGVYQISLAAKGLVGGNGNGSASVKAAAVASTGLVVVFAAASAVAMLFTGRHTVVEVPFQLANVLALLLLNALTLRGAARVADEVREATAPIPGVADSVMVRDRNSEMAAAARRLWRTVATMAVFSALAALVNGMRSAEILAGDDEEELGEEPDVVEPGTIVIAACQAMALIVGVLFTWVPVRRASVPVAPSGVLVPFAVAAKTKG